MLKAVSISAGRPVLVIGLSGENMARLMADESIVVDTTDPGLRGGAVELPVMRLLLFGGRDEQSMLEHLQSAAGPLLKMRQPPPAVPVKPTPPGPHGGSHELLMRMLAGEASRWRCSTGPAAYRVTLATAADELDKVAALIGELLESPPGVGVTLTALSEAFADAAGIIAMAQPLESDVGGG